MFAMRILIVEDEALVARDLQTTLTRLGYEPPYVARNKTEAISVAREQRFDLALMDIHLENGSDGIEVARILQNDLNVPVVYLTGQGDAATMRRASETQPYGYLLKPFHENELISQVESAMARHRAYTQVRTRELMVVDTMNSMAEGVISTDLLGKVRYMNPVAEKLTGWTQAEALGLRLHEVFRITSSAGKDLNPLGLEKGGVLAGSRSILLTRQDGTVETIEDNTTPIRDQKGSLVGIVVLFRKRETMVAGDLVTTLQGSMDDSSLPNLAGIVHSIADPLVALDANWKITYLNFPAASVLHGVREELVGKNVWDCLPPSIHNIYYHEFSQALAKGQSRSFEMEIEATNRCYEAQLYPFGQGLLGLLRDVTTRKIAEEKERKLEKLESLGVLARGFAHDFNNLLTVLLGNLSLAEMQIDSSAPGASELLVAKRATLQAQGLVQHLLTFARGGVPVKQTTDLGRLIRDWMNDWFKQPSTTYHLNISPSLMQADVDRRQFTRLIHNLVRNAEQASQGQGNVTVHMVPANEAQHLAFAKGSPVEPNDVGNWLLLQIIDDGQGIPLDDHQRVFEPYFTTREDVHASGLGLTVSESIAKAHGAKISLHSVPGQGTTLNVWIPAHGSIHGVEVASKNSPAASPTTDPVKTCSTRKVLILEDEPLINQLMTTTLKSINCQVDQTYDGAETIARYTEAMESGLPYDLIIMDLSIPNGMGGLQAIDKILHLDPSARAIVSSGYCDDPVLSRYMDYGFRAVLPKPYQPQELKVMVESMLK